MEIVSLIKNLLTCSFLMLCINRTFLCLNAASFVGHHSFPVWQKTAGGNFIFKQINHEVGSHRQAAASAKTFLELILGVVDTMQFGKRKIGTP